MSEALPKQKPLRAGAWEVPAGIFESSLGWPAKWAHTAIWQRADRREGEIMISASAIAADLGLKDVRTSRDYLDAIIEAGYIEVIDPPNARGLMRVWVHDPDRRGAPLGVVEPGPQRELFERTLEQAPAPAAPPASP